MLLVLASRRDAAAQALVERWRAAGEKAALVTCADLSVPGWTLDARRTRARSARARAPASSAAAGGRLVRAGEVEAVISRLGVIDDDEVSFLDEQDRAYGAAEIQAFLYAWLAELDCPVMNRPSASRLDGPEWTRARWTRSALGAGLSAKNARLRAAAGEPADEASPAAAAGPAGLVTAHVVGSRCFGDADEASQKAAVALAVAAGVDLLRVRLEPDQKAPARFHEADALIDVTDPGVAAALRERCRK